MFFGLSVMAIAVAAVGCGLLWYRRSVGKEIALMAATQTSGAGSIAALAPGTLVAAAGTLRCRSPLAAEFSQKPSAYFAALIERTETYYERDAQGKEERKTRTITVHSNVQYGSCLIEDATGRVGIDFAGANVEAIETVNEPTAAPSTGSSVVGGLLSALANSNYTYRRRESILPPDIPVYVLGEVHEGALIGAPATGSKNKIFVISHKSKEARTRSLIWTTRWLLLGAIALFAIAAGLAGWAVSKGGLAATKSVGAEPLVFATTNS